MILAERDLFESWRLLLTTICTIYALVVTGRSLWGWAAYLSAPGKTTSLMRSYAFASLLRIRLRRFTGEWLQIAFLLAALLIILDLHRKMGAAT